MSYRNNDNSKSRNNKQKTIALNQSKEHSFHSLRHFFACQAINSGADLETVRDLLVHSDFRSTLIYTRVMWGKLQQAVMDAFKWSNSAICIFDTFSTNKGHNLSQYT